MSGILVLCSRNRNVDVDRTVFLYAHICVYIYIERKLYIYIYTVYGFWTLRVGVNRKLFMWWLMCDYSQFCAAKSASKFVFFNTKVREKVSGKKNCDKTDKSQYTLVCVNQIKAPIFIQFLDLYFSTRIFLISMCLRTLSDERRR